MKPERFKRTKSVMASSAIALLVAALVMGVSSLVLGSKSASSEHLGFGLTSGSSSFTITGTAYTTPSGAYPAAGCSGTPAPLSPDVTRCVVFSVHDNLNANITVTGITTALDTTNYPAPPADCAGTNLVLPTFSGSINVTGGGDATSPGEPMELKNNGAPQNDCENLTYHYRLLGERELHRGLRHLHRLGLQPESLELRARASPTRRPSRHRPRPARTRSPPARRGR